MKWTTITGLLLFSLVLEQGYGPAYAQQKTVQAEEPAHSQYRGSLKWEKLENAQVLKVWQLAGKDVYPQVAILRVSNQDYIRFLQGPKDLVAFVNQHDVFSKKVTVAGPWVSLSSVDEKKPDPDSWVLTLLHGKLSTIIVSALPELQEEKPSPKP